jgi:hypothetical protein
MLCFMEFNGIAMNARQMYKIAACLTGELYAPPATIPPPDGIGRMLSVMGFGHEIFTAAALDEKEMARKIVSSLNDVGRSVIVVTDSGNWCFGGTVIGCENGSGTMVNWGYFPFDDSDDPSPVLSRNGEWYASDTVLAVIGERKSPVDPRDVYLAGIRAANEDSNGRFLAANQGFHADWQRVLRQTADETVEEVKHTRKLPGTWGVFDESGLTREGILNRLPEIVDPLWCDYAERRFYAARFLDDASHHITNPDLVQARDAFQRIHDRMYDYITKVGLGPGDESVDGDRFNDPAVRGGMADIAELCRLDDIAAARHLKGAAAALKA